jgi:hypothetical protein
VRGEHAPVFLANLDAPRSVAVTCDFTAEGSAVGAGMSSGRGGLFPVPTSSFATDFHTDQGLCPAVAGLE